MARYRMMHSFYLDPELSDGLKEIKDRDGISESEQVRRAVRQWLTAQGLELEGDAETRRDAEGIATQEIAGRQPAETGRAPLTATKE